MRYHKSCNTLMITEFTKINETNDYTLLLKGKKKQNLTVEEHQQLQKTFKKILFEYAEITKDTKLIASYRKRIIIAKLRFKYDSCVRALQLYADYDLTEVLGVLREFDYVIDEEKNIDKQIKKIVRNLKGIKTRLAILALKYEELYKPKDEEKKPRNLYEEATQLEVALKLGYELKPNKTTVTKWVTLINIAKSKK